MKKNNGSLVFLLVLFVCQTNFAQLTDLARLEYSFIPQTKSEDQYTRFRLLLNYPLALKNKSYLIVGGEYNRVLLKLEEDYPFNTSALSNIHIIDFNLGYTFKIGENKRLGFKINPRIASTLKKSVSSDDYFINGGVFYILDKRKNFSLKHPYRLILGLTYNATTGLPFPLPFISYFRAINPSWSFSAGVPKSNIKYTINTKNAIQAFLGLDGYLANLQEPNMVNGARVDNVSLSVAVAGLGYDYLFTKHLVWYMYSGFTLRLNNVLRTKNRDEVFRLNNLNAFYLRTGFKFKI